MQGYFPILAVTSKPNFLYLCDVVQLMLSCMYAACFTAVGGIYMNYT